MLVGSLGTLLNNLSHELLLLLGGKFHELLRVDHLRHKHDDQNDHSNDKDEQNQDNVVGFWKIPDDKEDRDTGCKGLQHTGHTNANIPGLGELRHDVPCFIGLPIGQYQDSQIDNGKGNHIILLMFTVADSISRNNSVPSVSTIVCHSCVGEWIQNGPDRENDNIGAK